MTGRSEVECTIVPDACEYCGRPGCHWSRHPAAVVEVRLDAAGKLPGWKTIVKDRQVVPEVPPEPESLDEYCGRVLSGAEPWRDDPRHDEGGDDAE